MRGVLAQAERGAPAAEAEEKKEPKKAKKAAGTRSITSFFGSQKKR